MKRGVDSGVLPEDAPDLPDHLGMVQANVKAMDKQLGDGALQIPLHPVATPTANETIPALTRMTVTSLLWFTRRFPAPGFIS